MKKLLFILVSMFLVMNLFPENKIDAEIIMDFYSYPFFYESTNNMYGSSFNGSLFIGARINQFSVGAEIYEHYVSLTSQNDPENYKGAWNIIRAGASFYYTPVNWFQLKAGIGGSYYRSAFTTNDYGTLSRDEGGLSLIFDAIFKPPFQYFELKIPNRLDFFFNTNSVSPYYYGGINCIFHPYLNWISLYNEIGVMTFIYKGEPRSVNSAMFVWSIGISVDLTFPSMIKYKKKEDKKPIDNVIVKNDDKIKTDDKIVKEDNKIEKLENIEKGQIVAFDNIIFYTDSDKIKEESYPQLDKIADVLKKRNNITVEIRGHTNNTNNPKSEMELSIKRAEMVKKYLIGKGIAASRMICAGFGSQFSKNNTIEESNRKVEFRILEDK